MRGLGVIVNVIAIIVGSSIGLVIKNGLKKRFQDILVQACGVATLFLGISGALTGLLSVTDGGVLETKNTMLLVFSMVLGSLFGEALNIELHMEQAGEWLKEKVGAKHDSRFVEGFVTVTLITCVGAMSIVGSLQDGLTGDATMIFTKSILDFVIVIVFASTLGIGVMFSAIPLGIYQGAITLFAVLIARYVSDNLIANLSCVGSVLIFCVGLNLVFGKKVKVGNMLPALLIPVFYQLIGGL